MQVVRKLVGKVVIGAVLTFAMGSFVYADPVHDLYDKAWKKAWMENKVSEGLVMFKEILTKYPDSEWADDALWNVAYAYGAPLHDDAKRYSACEKLLKKYPNSKWADDAMRAMVGVMYRKDWEDISEMRKYPEKEPTKEQKTSKSIGLARKFLKRFPSSQFAPKVKFHIAEIYRYKLKKYDKAIKEAQEIISKYPDDRETPEMYLVIGYIYEEQLDEVNLTPTQRLDLAKSAEKWYRKFLKKYPNREDAKEAKEALRSIREKQNR